MNEKLTNDANEWLIEKSEVVGPIERIRGGPISVTVNVTFRKGDLVRTIPGNYTCELSDDLPKGIINATLDAKNNLNKIYNLKGTEILVKELLQPKVAALEGDAKTLSEPVHLNKQPKITELCEVIGIIPINIEGWTYGEALCLYEELKEMARKFEYNAENERSR